MQDGQKKVTVAEKQDIVAKDEEILYLVDTKK